MRRVLSLAILSIALLLPALPSAAQTVCCACRGPSDTDDSCLKIDSDKLTGGGRINNPCTRLPSVVGATLQGWTCEPGTVENIAPGENPSGKCRTVPEGGICQKGPPTDAFAAGGAPASETVTGQPASGAGAQREPLIIPELNVEIPGFAFTGAAVSQDSSSLLAQYIGGIYGYAISIASVAATIMFTYGAFLYLLGSAITSIQSGKRYMQEAVLGMILVLGAHMILRTINPATLTLEALHIKGIDPIYVGGYRSDVIPTGGQAGSGPYPKPADAEAQIMAGARLTSGVDPCAVLAICYNESQLKPVWSGWYSGAPKEKATAFGPCQQATEYMHSDNPIAVRTKQLFPDFPLFPPSARGRGLAQPQRAIVGDWLMRNYKAAGYVAALTFKAAAGNANGNEVSAIASYYGGDGSLKFWRQKNKCTPQRGVQLRSNPSGDLATVACIPEFVAVINKGADPKGCPEDNYICPNAKANARAEYEGRCSNPSRVCYAAKTGSYVRSIMNTYKSYAAKLDCKPGTQEVTTPQSSASASTSVGNKRGLQAGERILLIGDSLSVGLAPTLNSLARQAGYTFSTGPGEVGSNIVQWAPGGNLHSRLRDGLLQRPKIVLVSLGTNDAYLNTNAAQAEFDELQALITTIETAGAKVIWIGAPPLPQTYGGNNLNNVILPEIRRRVSSQDYFSSESLDIPRAGDRLHPTGTGYAEWANQIWSWL